MIQSAILTVRTDPKIKEAAQKVARELGIPLSVVVNASLRDFVLKRQLKLKPLVPNIRTARLLDTVLKETRGKVYSSSKEMFKNLDS